MCLLSAPIAATEFYVGILHITTSKFLGVQQKHKFGVLRCDLALPSALACGARPSRRYAAPQPDVSVMMEKAYVAPQHPDDARRFGRRHH